jgi:cytosol aminopeptidase family protein
MKLVHRAPLIALVALIIAGLCTRSDDSKGVVKETALEGPLGVKIKVRMEGPYTAETPLQVVCFFKYTAEGVKKMSGAPVELDKELHGVIGSLRERGQFAADPLETIVISPPKGTIKAKALLLIGLGAEDGLSQELLEGVGRTALREASRLGISQVAFAPLIRDQGNSKFSAGEVETAVVRGMLLGYDTDRRLQKEGFSKEFVLNEWNVEAGPTYFDETVAGVQKAIEQAGKSIEGRGNNPLVRQK